MRSQSIGRCPNMRPHPGCCRTSTLPRGSPRPTPTSKGERRKRRGGPTNSSGCCRPSTSSSSLPTLGYRTCAAFTGWRRLAADAPAGRTDIEPWLDGRTLTRLAEVESEWTTRCEPTALIHSDIRTDNLLVDGNDRVWLVDWAHGCNGPPWIDLIGLLPSVAMQGGPDPAEIWAGSRYGPDGTNSAPSAAVDAVVAGVAGYFTYPARRPPVPEIPMLRDFQEAQAVPARAWLRQRLGV